MTDDTIKEGKGENEDQEDQKKKTQNLVAAVILLSGMLLGSLFVDIFQIIRERGYSQKNLNRSEIFEANGKTWVAYSEPAVPVSVLNDDKCEKCDSGEVLAWLKRVVPTISTEKIAYDSEEGKKMISDFGLKTLPAFIFHKDVEKTELFSQASELFVFKNEKFFLNAQALGVPAGKYLSLPAPREGNAYFGPEDAKVKVIVFSDFECPYCKLFHSALRKTMENYKDRVRFIFKQLPLDIHEQANGAANASLCALEQGKFWEYGDQLYAKQTEWGNANSINRFKSYAGTLRLNVNQFGQCLDGKKYQEVIDADKKEAEEFGLTGTPTVFVGDQSESGAISEEQLKEMIEKDLNKS